MTPAPITPGSSIERVTVYRLGATVRRVAEFDTPPSLPAELHVPGLPLQLRDETLQLSIEPADGADPSTCPQAVDVQIGLEPPPPEPGLPPATDRELRDAQRLVRQRRQELGRVDSALEALNELVSPERPEGAEGEPPPLSPPAPGRHSSRSGASSWTANTKP